VKILVGNKVDKVNAFSFFFLSSPSFKIKTFFFSLLGILKTSIHIRRSPIRKRMNSLFIETSAKTAINVKDVFHEVVQKILDTPELWQGSNGKTTSTSGGNGGVPGGVQVVGLGDENKGTSASGCEC
jgi:GTPase SAR1 family protein